MNAKDEFRAKWDRAALKLALSKETKDAYWHFTRRLHLVCAKRGSHTWTGSDWEHLEFWMAEQKPLYSYSSRKLARSAMNFIFKHVLGLEVGKLNLPYLPKPEPSLVVVPTREELSRIFTNLHGQIRLACLIMHGSGARVKECCRIRVQDLDLDTERPRVRLWDGKGSKNRVTVLPRNLLPALQAQIDFRRLLHERDCEDGNGFVELPERCSRKFAGQARDFGWQWLLPSSEVHAQHRWYVSPDTIGAKMREARKAAGIIKRIGPHSLRKCFASECAQAGVDIRTIQAMLGHANINTTSTHYLAINLSGAFSPADLPSQMLYRAPEQLAA